MNLIISNKFIPFNFKTIASFDYVLWELACICKLQDNLDKDIKIFNEKFTSTSADFSKLVISMNVISQVSHLNTIILRLALQALYE